jgi:acetyl-CoA C-acetyltransferase
MSEAFIVDAVRTPVGRRGGGLAGAHPADVGGHVMSALIGRTGIDSAAVDDVIFGCVDTIVLSGTADLVVAGGVQNMSQIPIGAAMLAGQPFGFDDPFGGSDGWRARYDGEEISQFRAAGPIAAKWRIGRAEMERYALASHQRAAAAIDAGAFAAEIVPYGDVIVDECPRRDTSLERMAALAPLRPAGEGGVITAALSSQVADAAAALLIASDRAVREHGLRPRARICHLSARGDDPVPMLTAPIAATRHAPARGGITLDQIDLIEINEAFASVVLAWLRETGADSERVNVSGGALALGHPLGATGARLMTTLLYGLERTGGRYGLQTMCEGGGQADVTIIERL